MCMTLFPPFPPPVAWYFDNVGGDVTDAVLLNARNNCKIAICGSISEYDNKEWNRFIACLTYKHTHTHTYIHTYLHTYIHKCYVHDTCVNGMHIHVSGEAFTPSHEFVFTITKCIYAQMHPCLNDKLCAGVCNIWTQGWAKKMEHDPHASHLHQGEMCRCLYIIFKSVDIFGNAQTQANTCLHTHKSQKHTYTHAHSCTYTHT